jgi:23S rRNA (uracil1939-C5)-methyltransferase
VAAIEIDLPVEPMELAPVASRRRAVFHFQRQDGRPQMGYRERRSHTLVDLNQCPVLLPAFEAVLPQIKAATAMVGGNAPITVAVLWSDTGADIAWTSDRQQIKPLQQEAICSFAGRHPIGRISHNGDQIYTAQSPKIPYGDVWVSPPAGSFIQASQAAEEMMTDIAAEHLSDCRHVADLFCGFGSFALRLASRSQVTAIDSDEGAISALLAGRDSGTGLQVINTETRDLFRAPMQATELVDFDGLVFDPPRAGARGQAVQIAASTIKKVVAVSCNPTTLARDLAILVSAGYQVDRITPIDQFVFTPHLECVVCLTRR